MPSFWTPSFQNSENRSPQTSTVHVRDWGWDSIISCISASCTQLALQEYQLLLIAFNPFQWANFLKNENKVFCVYLQWSSTFQEDSPKKILIMSHIYLIFMTLKWLVPLVEWLFFRLVIDLSRDISKSLLLTNLPCMWWIKITNRYLDCECGSEARAGFRWMVSGWPLAGDTGKTPPYCFYYPTK